MRIFLRFINVALRVWLDVKATIYHLLVDDNFFVLEFELWLKCLVFAFLYILQLKKCLNSILLNLSKTKKALLERMYKKITLPNFVQNAN